MAVVEFSCPSCSHPLSASEDKVGAEARCPGCGSTVLIPGTARPITVGVRTQAIPDGSGISSEERTWGMLCHLSSLLAVWAGGMAFLGPLICWLAKKDTSPWVDYHGKEALNFQLNMLGWVFLAGLVAVVTCGLGAVLIAIPLVMGIVMPIVAAVQANEGKPYSYPGVIRIIT